MAEINWNFVRARKNGRGQPRKYSDKDEVFFCKLVRDGMEKRAVCEKYNLSRSGLYWMFRRQDPGLIQKPGGRRGKRYTTPKQDPRSNACPICSPVKGPEEGWTKKQRLEWGHTLHHEPDIQLQQYMDRDGVVFDLCDVCGYSKRLTPYGGGR